MIIRRSFAILYVCLLSVTTSSFSAMAAEYQIFDAKDQAVCDLYKKNLDFYKDQLPFHYEWPIHSSITEFSKPQWEVLDPASHMEIFQDIYSVDSAQEQKESARKSGKWQVEHWMERGLVHLEKASVTSGGHAVTIYRYGHPPHKPNGVGYIETSDLTGWSYYIPAQNGYKQAYYTIAGEDDILLYGERILFLTESPVLYSPAKTKFNNAGYREVLSINEVLTSGFHGPYGSNGICAYNLKR